jgi:hypothetical protein
MGWASISNITPLVSFHHLGLLDHHYQVVNGMGTRQGFQGVNLQPVVNAHGMDAPETTGIARHRR